MERVIRVLDRFWPCKYPRRATKGVICMTGILLVVGIGKHRAEPDRVLQAVSVSEDDEATDRLTINELHHIPLRSPRP